MARKTDATTMCYILLLFCCVSVSTVSCDPNHDFWSRRLFQDGETIVSENAAKLGEYIKQAQKGETLLLEAQSVIVDALIRISVKDLRIKGASKKNPTTVQCASHDARIEVELGNAVGSRSNGVVFEDVVIRDCAGPAVRIKTNRVVQDPFAPQPQATEEVKPLTMTLKRVSFVNNTAAENSFFMDQSLAGGALQVTDETTAVVQNCLFEGNFASNGGAIEVDGGSLDVRNSAFTNNEAHLSGGAIFGSYLMAEETSETTLLIEDCTFYGNRDVVGGEDRDGLILRNGAPLETSEFLSLPTPRLSGGAIYMQGFKEVNIRGSIFDGNQANPAGGALFVGDNLNVLLQNNTFRNNAALYRGGSIRHLDLEQGGAIYVAFTSAMSHIHLERCVFQNNTAMYGGAVHMVMMLVSRADMKHCDFIENSADLSGGAVVLRNVIEVEFLDTKFLRNRATAGGALLLTNGAGARFTQGLDRTQDTVFEENIALDGGACFFLGAGQVHSQKLVFLRNKAQRNGGAMCLVESLASGSVTLQQSYFEENTARRGGGIFMDSIANLWLMSPSESVYVEFHGNKAMAGGAIYLRPASQVKNVVSISNVNMTRNQAVKRLEDIYREPLAYARYRDFSYASRRARDLLQMASETVFEDKADGTEVLLRTTGDDPCSPGGGGALCLVLSDVCERASVEVKITDSAMSQNAASTGGAMFISTKKKSEWRGKCDTIDLTAQSIADNPCRQLSLRNIDLFDNVAANAGGAIFASDASQVHYSKDENDIAELSHQPLSALQKGNHPANRVIYGGYGGQYASNGKSLHIIASGNESLADGVTLLAENHASGTPLPVMRIEIVDAFGHTVSSGISDSKMKVTVSSQEGIVSGQLVAKAEAGVALFDSLVVTADPGTYQLIFSAEEDDIVNSYVAFLSIRECNIGEHNITTGKICARCQPGFYGFDPAIPCQACPSEANCTGGASLVPRDGYWHSTPFSTQFHTCLVRKACSYPTRQDDLRQAIESDILPGETAYSNDDYPQCNAGYKDVVCGSCERDYGNKPGGQCVECGGNFATYGIVSIVVLWQLVLLGFTIRSALNSIRDMRDMRAIVARNNNGRPAEMPNTYQLRVVATPTASSIGGISSRKLSVCGSPINDSRGAIGGDSEKSIGLSASASSRALTPIDHIIAAETMSETIKIGVNFLQVTSVAVSINVEWTETVKRMLETENSAAGFSNGAAFVPLTCLLEETDSRSINGTILRVAFPVVLLFFVICFFFLNWIRIRVSQNKGLEYLTSRAIISSLVALFFSYEAVNRELMRIVNCVQLDEEDGSDETGYSRFAVARGRYWGEDTAFKCFEGQHYRLLVFMGIPGLALFSFGIPAFLLVFLLISREKKRINEQKFLNNYGFVYQNYTERFVYWEVSIMLRKACIGGIVVFAYPLGANLQGIMALGVLIVALVLHLVTLPFKYRTLNILESFSLLVSIFTFYSGIVFNDSNTSYPAKVLLSALLLLINASLFVMFVVRILMDADKFVTAKLVIFGETELPETFVGRSIMLARVFMLRAKAQVQITIQTQASRFSRTRTRIDRPAPTSQLAGIEEGDLDVLSSAAESTHV